VVAHDDNNKKNNRATNLRWTTIVLNEVHKPPSSRNNSGLKCVSYEDDRDKFRVRLMNNGHNLTLGIFDNTYEGWFLAGETYDKWARFFAFAKNRISRRRNPRKLYGTYAYQNFYYEPYETEQFLMEFENPLTKNGKLYRELQMKGYRL